MGPQQFWTIVLLSPSLPSVQIRFDTDIEPEERWIWRRCLVVRELDETPETIFDIHFQSAVLVVLVLLGGAEAGCDPAGERGCCWCDVNLGFVAAHGWDNGRDTLPLAMWVAVPSAQGKNTFGKPLSIKGSEKGLLDSRLHFINCSLP